MIYLLLSVLLNSVAQIAMKLASSAQDNLKELLNNRYLLVAGGLYVVSIYFWLKGLANVSLSKAYPLQSLGYILVISGSVYFLHEKVTVRHLVGILIICIGIIVIGSKA